MKKLITVIENRFVDLQGRHTILHGINMVCKDKESNYIGDYKEEDFKNLQKWGFNVIRLGIFWDGVEPQPGIFDDQYLSQIDKLIKMAGKYGIYVFLDMHQDLFGCQFSDGAPVWATLTEGVEHVETDLWSEAYLISGAVQTAFDNFWNNKKACDGIGIQDHYINMWKHIAARYKDNESVIGYDIMNEPFMGSGVNAVLQALLEALGEAVPDLELPLAAWADQVQNKELLHLLTDKEQYSKLMKKVQELPQEFERTQLEAFYNKTGRAIREEDRETLLFLETNYFSNAGMMSAIHPVTDEKGIRDKKQVFAPHGYDILVDTEMYDQASNERIAVIFEEHRKVQEKLNLPMLVGEWGCYPNATEVQLPQAAYLTGIFEKYLAGDTYYDFSHIYHNRITEVIIRAYPMKAAGKILSYGYHYKTGDFHCEIQEKKAAGSSILYIPNLDLIRRLDVKPYGDGYTLEKIKDSNSGYLIIPAYEDNTVRKIRF